LSCEYIETLLAALCMRLPTLFEKLVVEPATLLERRQKHPLLSGTRIKPVAEGPLAH
jgi:hypothetical protein